MSTDKPVWLLTLLAWMAAAVRVEGEEERTVAFVAVNDVYKLVGLPSDLPYFVMKASVKDLDPTLSSSCDGQQCPNTDAVDACGTGTGAWEACFPGRFAQAQELNIKEYGKTLHGLEISEGPCGGASFSEGENYGGLIDFAATFKWLKEEVENEKNGWAVGTLAGDFIGPSYLAEIHKGSQLVEIMNHMGVDLANIGNHDIDFKLPVLRQRMKESAFHYLNANLKAADGTDNIQQPMVDEDHVQGNFSQYPTSRWRRLDQHSGSSHGVGYAVFQAFEDVKVCVLGTTDVDVMNWKGKGIEGTARDIPVAIRILNEWKGIGCTLNIAMTHTRSGNDLNLFRAVDAAGLHLDAIIGGHDHYAAFAELTGSSGKTTHLVKTGADARIVAKLTFKISAGQASASKAEDGTEEVEVSTGSLELVPVVTGKCSSKAQGDSGRAEWFNQTESIFQQYVHLAEEASRKPLHVDYKGYYDTSIVRDAESRAVNLWLDLMRESFKADAVFFQAGLVRQDMVQNFKTGLGLSELFMFEEFPWPDNDDDARSSLFPFKVSLKDLVTVTLPWMARQYWCDAPFNDANRIHMSGFIVELAPKSSCSAAKGNPLLSVSFVGACHRAGGLQWPGECGPGVVWTQKDGWQKDDYPDMQLTVLTGQFCVPSKYKTHGHGFHDVGMSCPFAEKPFEAVAGVKVSLAMIPDRLGYQFKPKMLEMLKRQGGAAPVSVGSEEKKACNEAEGIYVETSASFLSHCLCHLGGGAGRCEDGQIPMSNSFPRFHQLPDDTTIRVNW